MLLGSFTAVVGVSLSGPYTSGTVLHTCVCNYYIHISFRVHQGTDYIEFRVPRARLNTDKFSQGILSEGKATSERKQTYLVLITEGR